MTGLFHDESLPLSRDIQQAKHVNKLIQHSVCGIVLLIQLVLEQATKNPELPEAIKVVLLELADIFQEPNELPP